jgi:hypothetical protein
MKLSSATMTSHHKTLRPQTIDNVGKEFAGEGRDATCRYFVGISVCLEVPPSMMLQHR